MKTFTEESMIQDARFRRPIPLNHWKAVSGVESWAWGWLEEGRFFIWTGERKSHKLVRGFLFIGNFEFILLFQSGLFSSVTSFERTSLKTSSKMVPYLALCALPSKYLMLYLFVTLLFNSPPEHKLPEGRGFLKATMAVSGTGSIFDCGPTNCYPVFVFFPPEVWGT